MKLTISDRLWIAGITLISLTFWIGGVVWILTILGVCDV